MSLYDKILEKTTPKKSLNFGVINKVMLSGAIIAILIAIILLLAITGLSPQAITAEFSHGTIAAGRDATLIVTIYNPSKADLTNIHTTIEAIDPAALIITKNTIDIGILGIGEQRHITIPVYTNANAYDGTYSIELNTTSDQMDFQKIRAKLTLE